LKSNAVSQQDVDNAVGAYNANRAIVEADNAAVEQFTALVSFERVSAPFDGVITARNTDIGDLINSGSNGGVKTDLFHIAQPGRLRVYVNVPEEYSRGIKAGMSADLSLAEFPGRKFQGRLVHTADAIHVATRTLLIEIDVDNPAGTLLTGSYAEVHLQVPTQVSTYLIPVNTLLFRSEGLHVAIVRDGKVELAAVTPRARFRQSDRNCFRSEIRRSGHCQPTRLDRFWTGSANCSGNIARRRQVKRLRKLIVLKNSRRAPLFVVLLASAVLQLSGCSVGPKYHTPVTETPQAYKEVGNWKPAQPNDQNLGGTWWTIFQDRQLDAFELQVNVSNQNLKAAEAQYQQARAVLRYSRADYYPTITAGPSATRTRVSANRPPPNSILNGITENDFVLPVDLSYQVDVWGRVRRTVESNRELAQASAADLARVNLSMHADLAIDYFEARSLDAQEQLLNSTVKQYEQASELTLNRFQGGIASEVEVEQAKTQLQTTRAAAIDVGVIRAQYEHAVAILIGKPPAEFSLPPLPLTAPPPDVPVSVPSDLLERRPDIAAAERRVAAANAQIGVAKSAYYPTISLGASGGFESSSIGTCCRDRAAYGPLGFLPWGLYSTVEGAVPSPTRRVPLTTFKSLLIQRAC